ncbi:Acyl carrier protein phosphodiesterase [subsurface metagenome]
MNFLAHLYLSGDSNEIKVGNFIGDYVKGKNFKHYPNLIKKGILLHRHIDSYTDSHPIIKRSKSYLNFKYKRFSGIIVDIFYDHFLALEWAEFSDEPLQEFVNNLYDTLVSHYSILPKKVQEFLPLFIQYNWLESYLTIEGIKDVLSRMSRRTSLPDETQFAIEVLKKNYSSFRADFLDYFPQLIHFVESEHGILISKGQMAKSRE